MSGSHRRTTEEQDKQICEAYKATHSVRKVTEQLGVKRGLVRERLREAGIELVRGPHTNGKEKCHYCFRFIYPSGKHTHERQMHPDIAQTDKNHQRALVLGRRGMAPILIAQQIGVAADTIRRWLDKAGIPRRHHKRKRALEAGG